LCGGGGTFDACGAPDADIDTAGYDDTATVIVTSSWRQQPTHTYD
jgi:hypothetical protein